MSNLHPSLEADAALLQRAKPIRLLFLDVDGVLTDGTIYYSSQGEALKPFNTLDGQGIRYLRDVGIEVGIISGRGSESLRARAQDLGIKELHMSVQDKRQKAQEILTRLGFEWSQVAVMGDDWPDLPLLNRAGLSCAPSNAHPELRIRVHCVTSKTGGHGAVREVCDFILKSQGLYSDLLAGYLT
jgi:3-deoxy-D-manno-octulosonate 8-phosphate phosphatase (KDO 8-P phosphatase)